MWGKTPSSSPTKKTTGNSNPLAECNVMSETKLSAFASSSSSPCVTKVVALRKSANELFSALLSSKSCATETTSMTFSTLANASEAPRPSSSRRLSLSLVTRKTSSTSSGKAKNSACLLSSATCAAKVLSAPTALPLTPLNSWAAAAACRREHCLARASSPNFCKVTSPKPRRGTLMTRLKLMSSWPLTRSLR